MAVSKAECPGGTALQVAPVRAVHDKAPVKQEVGATNQVLKSLQPYGNVVRSAAIQSRSGSQLLLPAASPLHPQDDHPSTLPWLPASSGHRAFVEEGRAAGM